MDKKKVIGANLETLINASGLSKAEVARRVGVTAPLIFMICKGECYPSMETFLKLCEVFDCYYEEILGKQK